MKTFSVLIVMLSLAFTSFAKVPSATELLTASSKITLNYQAPSHPAKECSVTMTAQVVVGSVQCTINVTTTGGTCAEATASAISQLSEAKKAIQEALQ